MTDKPSEKKIRLTDSQERELRALARDPDANVGSCTNATMKALKRMGLADIKWTSVPGSRYRNEKWVITEAGRQWVVARFGAHR